MDSLLSDIYSAALLYARLVYDIGISFLNLFFGNILPRLKVPPKDLTGKTAIITGANSGIGYQLALDLAKCGATVCLACRNIDKGGEAAASIRDTLARADEKRTMGRVEVMELDTSSLKSVRTFASAWKEKQIDILIHNAGISSAPPGKENTDEGIHAIYATDFLGSYVLTALVEKYLASKARVIFTSATGQYGGSLTGLLSSPRGLPQPTLLQRVLGWKVLESQHYANTKLMQVAFAHLLQKRWDSRPTTPIPTSIHNARDVYAQQRNKGPIVHAFAPGYVYTPIFAKTPALPVWVDPVWWFLKVGTWLSIPVEQGAKTGLWLATSDHVEVVMGSGYWDRMKKRKTWVDVMGKGWLERVWQCWEKDGGVSWD